MQAAPPTCIPSTRYNTKAWAVLYFYPSYSNIYPVLRFIDETIDGEVEIVENIVIYVILESEAEIQKNNNTC